MVCTLKWNEIGKFFDALEKEKHFATVCAEKDAEFAAEGEHPLYFRFEPYSDEDIERIKSQAQAWHIYCVKTEEWDPTFGHRQGTVKKEYFYKVSTNEILVKDGNFAGVVSWSEDLGMHYGIFYALISDYADTPLRYSFRDGYGSSDCDMMYDYSYYLQKK